jgi:hypothetical protein
MRGNAGLCSQSHAIFIKCSSHIADLDWTDHVEMRSSDSKLPIQAEMAHPAGRLHLSGIFISIDPDGDTHRTASSSICALRNDTKRFDPVRIRRLVAGPHPSEGIVDTLV